MTVWQKLKALGWVITLGMVLTAVLFALAGARSVKRSNSAKRKEENAIVLQNSGIVKQIAQGNKLLKAAAKDKEIAARAKVTMKQQLEKLGDANEDIDDIAARHNARRVRITG